MAQNTVNADPFEPAIAPEGMTLTQKFFNNMSTVSPTEHDAYRRALALVPTEFCSVLQISRYLLDLAYQLNHLAVEIEPTTRGQNLSRMARNLNERAHIVLWDNIQIVSNSHPAQVEYLQP